MKKITHFSVSVMVKNVENITTTIIAVSSEQSHTDRNKEWFDINLDNKKHLTRAKQSMT